MENNLELAQAIARELAGEICEASEPDDIFFDIVLPPDDTKFILMIGGYSNAGRITVLHNWPRAVSDKDGYLRSISQRDFDHTIEPCRMSVSITKAPDKIAQDIKRRFLPRYLILYKMAVEYAAKQKDYWTKTAANSAQVEEAFMGVKDGCIKYISGDCVQVEVNVSAANAVKLAEFLKSLNEGK